MSTILILIDKLLLWSIIIHNVIIYIHNICKLNDNSIIIFILHEYNFILFICHIYFPLRILYYIEMLSLINKLTNKIMNKIIDKIMNKIIDIPFYITISIFIVTIYLCQ